MCRKDPKDFGHSNMPGIPTFEALTSFTTITSLAIESSEPMAATEESYTPVKDIEAVRPLPRSPEANARSTPASKIASHQA